jgi:diguanylate cyclase (GGDEF)-like protein/PAS domain S-box-containing protein
MSDRDDKTAEPAQLQISLSHPATIKTLLETISEGTYVASPDGQILDANPAFLQMLGAGSIEDLEAHRGDKLWVSPSRRSELEELVAERGSVHEFEIEVRRLDGSVITVLETCQAQRGSTGEIQAFYGVLLDVTERQSWEDQLAELNMRDPLTGCYNQRYLESQRPALERPSHFWGCLIFDLEGLKTVNEQFGPDEGDRVLQRFAHFVIRHKRAEDVLVRIGGDEFALLVEVRAPDNMKIIAQRLLDHGPQQAPLAFGVGYSYRRPGETVEQVLGRAKEDLEASRGPAEIRDRRNV